MRAFARNDLLAFWKQNFVPNNAALVVSGGHTSLYEVRGAIDALAARLAAGPLRLLTGGRGAARRDRERSPTECSGLRRGRV